MERRATFSGFHRSWTNSASSISACRSTCLCDCGSEQRDGYSGFEARYYSLFPSYDQDMAPATNLQQFLLALAYRLALGGEISHEQIPDDPTSESERRQPFFFSAAGVPAFYVHRESRNRFLQTLLQNCTQDAPQPPSSRIFAHLDPRLSAVHCWLISSKPPATWSKP